MKWVLLLITLAPGAEVTPVAKVIQMLGEMKLQGEKDQKEEAVQFAAYKQFCELTAAEKKRVIADAKGKIEALGAALEKSESDAERLAAEIQTHLQESSSASADQQNATEMRETERKDFVAMLQDYTESVDAIGRALRELRGKKKEGALVQLRTLQLPQKASRGLQALLSEGFEDKLLNELGEAESFQMGGVVQMLEKLEEKFVDERIQLEKDETAKQHAYQLLSSSLSNQIKQAEKESQQKGTMKAKKLQEKAGSSSELTSTEATLKIDEEYLKELEETCTKKANDFAERQKLRGEELVAIEEATKAMSQVAGGEFLQATSLAQLWSLSPVQAEVARFLQRQAREINSRVLSAVAERASADPMGKVKKMIEGLITRLKDQANEETTKKAWCDAELASNKAAREEKGDAVSSLQAEMDKLQAAMSKLDQETEALTTEVTELDTATQKALELRKTEKAKNQANLEEAEKGQEAVAKALSLLKEFYAKAAAASLLQRVVHGKKLRDAPGAIFEEGGYAGMNSKGVLSMLEVIESDFSRMEAETKASEAEASKEHDAFIEESKITKAQKSKDLEHKKSSKQEKSSELISLQADLQGTEKELAAADAYLEKLKPDCMDAGVSYAERKAKREQEMKDLKEALEMLSSM